MFMPVAMTQEQMLLLAGAILLLAVIFIVARRLGGNGHAPATRLDDIADAMAVPAEPAPAEPAADETGASPFLAAPDGPPDDLARIKGIGPKLSALLTELGVYHYRQIAGWTPAQLAIVNSRLGRFEGRPERDQWQSQAALLASGDVKAYERAHGRLAPDDPARDPARRNPA